MTVAGEAEPSAAGVGNWAMERVHASAARAACGCWAMTSETRTDHGSVVRRKARSRAFSPYHSSTADCISAWTAGATLTSVRYGGAIRRGLLDPADGLAVPSRRVPGGGARRFRHPLARRSP